MDAINIELNFANRELTDSQRRTLETLRRKAQEFAGVFFDCVAPGREASLALTNLEQSLMWAEAAVTRPRNIIDALQQQAEQKPTPTVCNVCGLPVEAHNKSDHQFQGVGAVTVTTNP